MSDEQIIQVQPVVCPMCANKRLGERWTRAIVLGEKSAVDAASIFKMSIKDVEEHVYKHTQNQVATIQPSYDKKYFVNALDKMNTNLETILDETMMSTEMDVRKLTSLTKEIRETLKLLAEVAGVIGVDNSATMNKNLIDMQQKYAVLTGIILEEACPECQRKIVARIKGVTLDGSKDKIEP